MSLIKIPKFELVRYETPDGTVFNLQNPPNRALHSMSGWGLPQREIRTAKDPFHHRVYLTNYRLESRTITATLIINAENRDSYWIKRTALIDHFRMGHTYPDTPSLGTLKWIRRDGTMRALDCILQGGLALPDESANDWRKNVIIDQLEFFAPDPIVYDPNELTFTLDGFDASSSQSDTLTYAGTWFEYPTITITGPGEDVMIQNTILGYLLSLEGYTLVAGETVTITLTPGSRGIESSVNGNIIEYLDYLNSHFALFALYPSPLVTGGNNPITASIDSGTAATQVDFTYKNRYEGV